MHGYGEICSVESSLVLHHSLHMLFEVFVSRSYYYPNLFMLAHLYKSIVFYSNCIEASPLTFHRKTINLFLIGFGTVLFERIYKG